MIPKLVAGKVEIITPNNSISADINGNTEKLGGIITQNAESRDAIKQGSYIVQLCQSFAELNTKLEVLQRRNGFDFVKHSASLFQRRELSEFLRAPDLL